MERTIKTLILIIVCLISTNSF